MVAGMDNQDGTDPDHRSERELAGISEILVHQNYIESRREQCYESSEGTLLLII